MKNWIAPEITELNINATAQFYTTKMEFDDFQPGVDGKPGILIQGVNPSGTTIEVPWHQ